MDFVMKKLFTLLALFTSGIVIAQEAKITGTVFDKEFQEPLPFANVLVKETGSGTTTDFDGIYEVFVQPGTYTLEFSFVGYETITVSDLTIATADTQEINVSLAPVTEGLEEVVITVEALRNTEQSVLTVQKKSANLLDGISSQNFKKVGANDIANAVKTFLACLFKAVNMFMLEGSAIATPSLL